MVRTEHSIVGQVYAAKTGPEAADALIEQYMGFIRSETVKFIHAVPENGHEDELSIAMLAFYEAILSYERSRGAFLPYAAGPSATGSSTTIGQRSATEMSSPSMLPQGTKRTAACWRPCRTPGMRSANMRPGPPANRRFRSLGNSWPGSASHFPTWQTTAPGRAGP